MIDEIHAIITGEILGITGSETAEGFGLKIEYMHDGEYLTAITPAFQNEIDANNAMVSHIKAIT